MASKKVEEFLTKSDNPTQVILDNLFSKKMPVREKPSERLRSTEYLPKLENLRSTLGLTELDRPSYLMRETDPYQIFARYNQFERISSKSKTFSALAKELGTDAQAAFDLLSRKTKGIEILRKVQKVSRTGKKIFGKEMYIGNAEIGYIPLAAQVEKEGLGAGIVQYGERRFGAYKAGFLRKDTQLVEESFTQLFYKRFRQVVEGNLKPGFIGFNVNQDAPIVLFDIETTGKQVGKDLSKGADQEILQLSATKIEGSVEKKLNLYFTPEGEIFYEGHGLTKQKLKAKGAVAFKEKAEEIKEFFKGATLAGYNVANFDIPVLEANLEKAGVKIDLANQGIIDIYDLHKSIHPRAPQTLGEAFKYYTGKTLENAHDAAADVAASAVVLKKQLETLGEGYAKSLASLGSRGISQGVDTLSRRFASSSKNQATMSSLRRLLDVRIGIGSTGKEVTLRQLMATPESIRGMSDTALTAMFKGQELIVLEESEKPLVKGLVELESEFFLRKARFGEAQRTIFQVMKSIGRSVPEGMSFLQQFNLGEGRTVPSPLVALKAAYEEIRSYNEFIPTVYEKLGRAGMYPAVKPDFLVDIKKNIVLPTEEFTRVKRGEYSSRARKKGDFGRKKASPITESVARTIKKAGGRPVPFFMTEAEYLEGQYTKTQEYFDPTGENILRKTKYVGQRRPARVLAIKFKNESQYKILMQDSGFLQTEMGLQASATNQYLARLKIKSPSRKILRAYETLTGKSVLSKTPGLIDVRSNEVEALRDVGQKVLGVEDASSVLKNLTKRERALFNLMYTRKRDKATGKFLYQASENYGVLSQITGIAGSAAEGTPLRPIGGVLATPFYKTGTLTIELQTARPMAASATGYILAGNRMTGTGAREGNIAVTLLEKLEQARYLENTKKASKKVKRSAQGVAPSVYNIEGILGFQDVKKMDSLEVFLENFYATMDRHGIFADKQVGGAALNILGKEQAQISIAGENYGVAIGTSKRAAAIKALRVIKHLKDKGGKYADIADEARFGLNVKDFVDKQIPMGRTLDPKTGKFKVNMMEVEEARFLTVSQFKRSDQRLNTNIAKRAKITLGKLKILAMGAGLLGYDTPMDDPITRDLLFQQKMFGWDHTKKDFVVSKEHPISKFLTALADPKSVKPDASKVITVGPDGHLYLGNKQLKKLPELKEFSIKRGGVKRSDLAGTILDPELESFLYIDLGKERKLTLLGIGEDKAAKPILGDLKHRYIPFARDLLRAEGTVDAKVILTKGSQAYATLKMLESLTKKGTASSIGYSTLIKIREAVQTVFDQIRGKEGLLAKMHTIHLDTGFGTLLVPQQTTTHTIDSLTSAEDIFKGGISRKQVISALESRIHKYMDVNNTSEQLFEYHELLRQAKTEKYIFGVAIADPTQRPEHASLLKIKLLDEPFIASTRTNIVEASLEMQMAPSAFAMTSRDVDFDTVRISFTAGKYDSATGQFSRTALENRIARQAKAIEPVVQFIGTATKLAKTKTQLETVGEIVSAYTGQKTFAAVGYSEVRPTLERLIPVLAGAAQKGPSGYLELEKRFPYLKLSEVEVTAIGKLFGETAKEFGEKFGAAIGLGGYLFQAGVDKGISKSAQEELNIGLIELAEAGKTRAMTLEQSLQKSYNLFYNFLQAQKENRIFQTAFILQETSTPKVLEGLIQGAKDSQEYLLGKASALLASTVGLGYSLSSRVGSAFTVASVAEEESLFYNASTVFKKIITPITEIPYTGNIIRSSGTAPSKSPLPPGASPSSGGGPRVERAKVPPPPDFSARMSSLKKDLLESFSSMRKSKYFAPVALAVAAAAGIGLFNRMTAPDLTPKSQEPDYEGPTLRNFTASLPPPSDTSRPMDMGPSLPPLRAAARINTSSYTPSASRFRHNQKFGTVNSNFFENRVNNRMIIDDNTSSRRNSWLIRRQMDMESESDFAY